jgi:hypothetical protein
MTYSAQLAVPSYEEARTARRRMVDFTGMVRDANASLSEVAVSDLSTGGCRFQSDQELETASTVWLKIIGTAARQARIVWKQGSEYGCEFLSPMEAETLEEMCSGKSQGLRRSREARASSFGRAAPRPSLDSDSPAPAPVG